MHDLQTIISRNLEAPWREYRHAIDAGDLALARRIYWAELSNVVASVIDDDDKAAVRDRLAKA